MPSNAAETHTNTLPGMDASQWQFALECAGDGIWEWQARENALRFPAGLKALLGYEATPDDGASLLHPDDKDGVFRELNRHLDGTTPICRFECRFLTADGDYRWCLGRGKTVSRDAEGRPLRVLGTLIDIAGKKAVERELAAEKSRYRSVIEAVVDGIVVIDAQGVIQSLNPAAEHIFGYDAPELIGQSINRLMPEPYRSAHDQHMRRYLETGVAHVIGYGREVVGLRKNGGTFPISLAISQMTIDGAVYFTGIIRDISKRKQSEQALLVASSVYRSMGEAVMVTDAENNIITVNEPFTQLTGYELYELIGKNPKILASGRQNQAFYERMWHSLNTEGHWQGEIWNRRKSGQEYLETVAISVIYDEQGEALRHVAVFSEIPQ